MTAARLPIAIFNWLPANLDAGGSCSFKQLSIEKYRAGINGLLSIQSQSEAFIAMEIRNSVHLRHQSVAE